MSIREKLPNWLTFSRILAIPVVVGVFYLPGMWGWWGSWAVFTYAGVTDYFDGSLARKWGVQTPMGRFLDPMADKLLIAACIILLVSDDRPTALISITIPSIIILCRELLISGLREFLADQKITVPVSFAAKVKTTTQLLSVGGLLVAPGTPDWWHFQLLSELLYSISAILTVATAYQYLRTALPYLR